MYGLDLKDDENYKDDDDDEDADLDLDETNTSEQHFDVVANKKDHQIPTIDDTHLKYYARLVYNLNKLMEFKGDSRGLRKQLLTDELDNDCGSGGGLTSSLDFLNSNSDQPLYCMKIVILFSQLNQFVPDFWTLVNGENAAYVNKVFLKMKKLLKLVKDAINCLFQVKKI
jgi:hypothetical protein